MSRESNESRRDNDALGDSRGHRVERRIIILFLIVTGFFGYIMYSPNSWTWETPVDRTSGAIALKVDPAMGSLELELDPTNDDELQFALANEPGAARAWLRNKVDINSGQLPDGLWGCNGASKECTWDGGALSISLADVVPRDRLEDGRPRWVTIWLLPYREAELKPDSIKTYHIPTTPLRWRGIKVGVNATSRKPIRAAKCTDSNAADECLVARGILGHPRRVSIHDPQALILQVAETASAYIVPTVVWVMIVVNVFMGLMVITLVRKWYKGGGLSPTRGDVHASTVWAEARRLLEWFEVLGPAVAFAATVLCLVLAFAPAVFDHHDSARFTAEISLAMTATFCGLLLRILSFTADRLINHLAHWDADRFGNLSQGRAFGLSIEMSSYDENGGER